MSSYRCFTYFVIKDPVSVLTLRAFASLLDLCERHSQLGLAVPAKKPKRRRQGVSKGLPTNGKYRGHVWTWDFVHDTTKRGGKLRMLNIIDEYTRECLSIHVDRQINAGKVKKIFSKLID
jgi:transposase InsO family protein